jgi:hypothetical protein
MIQSGLNFVWSWGYIEPKVNIIHFLVLRVFRGRTLLHNFGFQWKAVWNVVSLQKFPHTSRTLQLPSAWMILQIFSRSTNETEFNRHPFGSLWIEHVDEQTRLPSYAFIFFWISCTEHIHIFMRDIIIIVEHRELRRERERGGGQEGSRSVEAKRKLWREAREVYFCRWGDRALSCYKAVPAWASDKNKYKIVEIIYEFSPYLKGNNTLLHHTYCLNK